MATKKKNQPISAWESGDTVQGFALLRRKEKRQDRNGRVYLDMELADASGCIAAKVWSASPALEGEYELHDFVAFKGGVKLYRDSLQISLDDCRRVDDDDRQFGFDESLLIPSTPEDIDALWGRLTAIYQEQIRRPVLQRLAAETLEVYGPRLKEHPAAKAIHHAYRGGLLEHTTSMAELAIGVCEHYPKLDRDLILLGILFHDLGKTRELGAMPANDYTLEGRMIGHVVIGRDLVRERAAAIPDFPAELSLHLEHLVLSHQGKKEFSSPVEPMTPEAFALHFIDDLDSKLNQLWGATEEGNDMPFLRALGRFVYLGPIETGTTEAAAQAEGEAEAENGEGTEGSAETAPEPPPGDTSLSLAEAPVDDGAPHPAEGAAAGEEIDPETGEPVPQGELF